MIYVVYGDQELLVNKMVNKIAKDTLSQIDDFNFVTMDASKITSQELSDELNSLPFTWDNKVISLINCTFLVNSNNEISFDPEIITNYLDNETKGVTLILNVNAAKLDEKRVLVKKLRAKGKVVEVNSLNKKDMPRIVKQLLNQKGVEISDSALQELVSRLDTDMYAITNEVEKLATYTNKLHLDDIVALTPRKLEDNIFDLIEALFKKDTNKAFIIYNDLKNLGGEAISMISIISTQVRFLYQVLVLSRKGYSEASIATELKVHPFRVKMGLEKVRGYSEEDFEMLLEELSKLDIKIKTGDIDRFLGLELFILNMTN